MKNGESMGTDKLKGGTRIDSVARQKERPLSETDYSKYDFSFGTKNYDVILNKGLSEETVREISRLKGEPEWMLDFRLKALKVFFEKPMPSWGADLSQIDFQEIVYYLRASKESQTKWEDVPEDVKKTFERLGIPEAEKKFLAGVSNQLDSEVVYHSIREDLEKLGVVFLSMDDGLKQYPELVKEHFSKVIPLNDNKFAALNSACWSGGSFVYVPKGVKVDIPLQAYFRINAEQMGQFERTLIIVDEGAQAHYLEGCFTKRAPVLTESGWRPIEEVQAGEKVWTHQNRWMPVYHTQKRPYSGNLNTIFYYGDSRKPIEVTDEHPFLAVARQRSEYKNTAWEPAWVKAAELQKSDYLVIPIDRTIVSANKREFSVSIGNSQGIFKDKKFELQTDSGFFRLIGYYLSEGTTIDGHYVTFTFHENERIYLDDVKQLLQKYFGKAPLENAVRNHGISLVLCSTLAARFFNQQFGHYVHTKQLPSWVVLEDPKKQAELIKGYWRGDGNYMSVEYSYGVKRMYRMNTVSECLAEQIRNMLLRRNIFASINVQSRAPPRKKMFCLYVGGAFLDSFANLVQAIPSSETLVGNQVTYQKNTLKQLVSYAQITEQYVFVPVKSIEKRKVENVLVYNFSVEEDESYIAYGVVVHNCTAPRFSTQSLHAAVVEVIVKKEAHFRYTTIQNWSNNIYNLVTKRAFAYENATVEWVDGNLGCLAEGSTVTTPQGIKTIESLDVGDKVLSFDEHSGALCFQPVIAKKFSGYQPVHTVSVGERKLDATANHPFYSYWYNPDVPSKLGRYNLAYVRADNLKEAIIPRVSIDYGNPHPLKAPELVTEFKSMNQYASDLVMARQRQSKMALIEDTTDDIMWLFGYWVGDGDIEIKQGKTEGVVRFAKVGFSTPPEDRARVKLMQTMTVLIEAKPTERADGHHLAWNSKELAEFFHINGFEGQAKDKRVPQWVWSLPESQRLAFVAGYLDADGSVKERQFSIKSVNHDLLADVASLLVTLGITARLYTEFSEPKTVTIMGVECIAHGAYRLAFGIDERFLKFISPALRKKAENQSERVMQLKRAVGRSNIELSLDVEIVPVKVSESALELAPTWDIEVAGTGNFVSQGFIVHNSKITQKYPAIYLMEPGAKGEVLSVALAGKGQHQDTGAKAVHLASNTTSIITSKSISKDGGRASYRGLLKVAKNAFNVKSTVRCDALLLDSKSRTDTYPYIEIDNPTATVGHEATVGKIGDDQLFYLMSRGLTEEQALTMIVLGFIQPFTKSLPMEYAVELNRLIEMEMENSVG